MTRVRVVEALQQFGPSAREILVVALSDPDQGVAIAAARALQGNGAIDEAISEGGWKIVAMLRLSPAIPFNLQNYLYGLTDIRFWTCVLTSWVAMIPGTAQA